MTSLEKRTARISIALAVIFLGILFTLHFLKPELDPSWRMISEYEIGRYGWMMRLAFACWGGSVLALLAAIWHDLQARAGRIARGWLVVIGLALFGAGIWAPNPILDETVSTENSLHTLCGVIVILTFPVAASITARRLTRLQAWTNTRRRMLWGTLLVWFSQFAFFGSIIVSRIISPSAGRVGPDVYLGWPNRFLVFVYVAWLINVAHHKNAISKQ